MTTDKPIVKVFGPEIENTSYRIESLFFNSFRKSCISLQYFFMNCRERGCELTLLHLEHVDQLDMSALCIIAETCPLLRYTLTFGIMYHSWDKPLSQIYNDMSALCIISCLLLRYLCNVVETCPLLRYTLTCHHFLL